MRWGLLLSITFWCLVILACGGGDPDEKSSTNPPNCKEQPEVCK